MQPEDMSGLLRSALERNKGRLLDSTGGLFLVFRKVWKFQLWGVRVLWWSESDDSLRARALARYDNLQGQKHLMRRCEARAYDEWELVELPTDELIRVCRTSTFGARVLAIEALGNVADLSITEDAVIEFLADDSPVMRESALYAAANWPAGGMVWDTVSAMASADPHTIVRSIAVETLEVMGEK